MTTARATLLLARTHWRVFLQRARYSLTENRLMTTTISLFLTVYIASAYILVSRGLEYVHRLPLLGPMLTERLVFVMFFFFFVMLVISNATITGMGLFRQRETGWQVALPLSFRSLVLWKTLEGMVLASWGLVVLSAPILAALGVTLKAGPGFYFGSLPALMCLVTISANVSTWILLALVRWAHRWWKWPVMIFAVGMLLSVIFQWEAPASTDPNRVDLAANINQILKHTNLCTHPLLPSSWVAESILVSANGINHRSGFLNMVLLSHALFSLVITAYLASRWFYPAWNRVMTTDFTTRNDARARLDSLGSEPNGTVMRLLGLDRASYALLIKDIRTFLREPAQWGQSALIFGLLFFYVSNLRRLGYDVESPLWSTVLSYLNLLVCALSLSTLTTRFIFPQFSMEGQRLWILGLAPVPLQKTLSLKLRLGASVIALITTVLIVISSFTVGLPWHRTLFFASSIVLLSYGLTALALALGTLAPNFREPNPAKIVSGFGGTLCLISSFLYILISMTLLLVPAILELKPDLLGASREQGSSQITRVTWEAISVIAVCLNTIIFGFVPYYFAKKHIKSLEYLRHLN